MSMTMTQKILAAHAGLQEVKAGDLIEAKLDLVLGNDITAPVAIRVFEQTGFKTVFDPERIAIVLDHYTPCKDIKSAELCQISRARIDGKVLPVGRICDGLQSLLVHVETVTLLFKLSEAKHHFEGVRFTKKEKRYV